MEWKNLFCSIIKYPNSGMEYIICSALFCSILFCSISLRFAHFKISKHTLNDRVAYFQFSMSFSDVTFRKYQPAMTLHATQGGAKANSEALFAIACQWTRTVTAQYTLSLLNFRQQIRSVPCPINYSTLSGVCFPFPRIKYIKVIIAKILLTIYLFPLVNFNSLVPT